MPKHAKLSAGKATWRTPILSEFYQLRRTTIKDLAAYIGFLIGFIGTAPFAWSLLSDQLAGGAFVRGLWYFFGIVTAGGIFAGIAGLGVGYVGGVLWEQLHRHRRSERLKAKALIEADSQRAQMSAGGSTELTAPRLQLVSVDSLDLPPLNGRTLTSIRFHIGGIQIDFGGLRLDIKGNPLVISGLQRTRYPEPGSRDALCSLIGDRIDDVRAPSAERIEIHFDSGSELVIPRSSVAVA